MDFVAFNLNVCTLLEWHSLIVCNTITTLMTLPNSLSLGNQNGEGFISLPQSIFNGVDLKLFDLQENKNLVNDILFSFYSFLPDRVGVHIIIEPQNVETEKAHDQGVNCGHQPGQTDRQTDVSNKEILRWLLLQSTSTQSE